MANIKELLGDAYKEGMTLEEVDKALEGKKLVDLSTGDYVAKSKYENLETKHKNLQAEFDQVKEQTKDYETLKKENDEFKVEKETATLKEKLLKNGISEKAFKYVKGDIDAKELDISSDDEKVVKSNVEKYLKEHPEFANETKPVVHKEIKVNVGGGQQTITADPKQHQAEVNKAINDGFREALGLGDK